MHLYTETPFMGDLVATGCVLGFEIGGMVSTIAWVQDGIEAGECVCYTAAFSLMGSGICLSTALIDKLANETK